jgi:hypothetical protein
MQMTVQLPDDIAPLREFRTCGPRKLWFRSDRLLLGDAYRVRSCLLLGIDNRFDFDACLQGA